MQGAAGAYSTSGGHLGLALIATLRDDAGHGPSEPWELRLLTGQGDDEVVRLSYDDPSPGSFVGWWFSDLVPVTGDYRLEAHRGGLVLERSLSIPSAPVLPFPQPEAVGGLVSWPAVDGAHGYACHVYAGGQRVGSVGPTRDTECDLELLPDGGYTVAVRAFSADLVGLVEDDTPEPWLPEVFEVTEQQVAIATGDSGGYALRASAGALAYGGFDLGLVLWASITGPDGEPSDRAWDLLVTGPGLPPGSPWRLTYPAGQPQVLVWSYDIRAQSGRYGLSASSEEYVMAVDAGTAVSEGLDLPVGVVSESRGGGGGDVSWDPVPGAESYAVSVWTDGATASELVWWRWTADTSVMVPSGTLENGVGYDVYVAAADVNMAAAPQAPAGFPIRMSENAYTPVRVIGR